MIGLSAENYADKRYMKREKKRIIRELLPVSFVTGLSSFNQL